MHTVDVTIITLSIHLVDILKCDIHLSFLFLIFSFRCVEAVSITLNSFDLDLVCAALIKMINELHVLFENLICLLLDFLVTRFLYELLYLLNIPAIHKVKWKLL